MPRTRAPSSAGIERIRPRLGADTRYHLRHETYNLDAEPEISEWLAGGRIDAIAFNDHMSGIVESADRAHKLAPMIERSGLSREDFLAVVERTQRRASEVPASIERLAAAANAAGTPLLSHDDTSPQQRRWFRSLGCRLAEFPTTVETAEEAASQGDDIVLGAPNVVRGGSHTGWIDASKMIERGLCSVLASDYYYPAPLLAAFALAARGVVPLEQAWMLVSRTPARAVRLTDRGDIARGQRADLVIVDPSAPDRPRVVATIVSGRVVHLAQADIIATSGRRRLGCCSRSRVMNEPRYAIYFVPPARSDLYRFGARFLGYDCYSGDDLGHPADIGLAATAWEELTREPRRYGFHATLKAPFRLLPPFTETDLVAELDRFIALPRASVSVEPTIRAIERFIAIVPRGASAAVEQLAADCVTVFDRFRRPLTPQERDRRVARGRGRSPDREPRPLGLPVRVRGLSLSHDADRRDRCEPPWADHRASAGCLRAS